MKDVTNSKCEISLINEKYFVKILFHIKSIFMSILINVRDIKSFTHVFKNYVIIDFFLEDVSEHESTREKMHKEFHVINELKCKILLEMNTMTSKKIILNFQNKILYVSLCKKLIIFIQIVSKSNARMRQVVMTKQEIIVSSKVVFNVKIYMRKKKSLLVDRDYIFELDRRSLIAFLRVTRDFYTHIVDCNMTMIQMKNDLSISTKISRRARLNLFIEYEEKNCFQINFKFHDVVVVTQTQITNF